MRTFNSTRCIRNHPHCMCYLVPIVKLSTPHGALGTPQTHTEEFANYPLSTPHGALGTPCADSDFPLLSQSFNSTRCIRNIDYKLCWDSYTGPFNSTRCIRNLYRATHQTHRRRPFNSTRCIRNVSGINGAQP